MKRPQLTDIKVFFLINTLSENQFWPRAIVSGWPRFALECYIFTQHYEGAIYGRNCSLLSIECHHNINMMSVHDCPWLLASNILITRLHKLPSEWAYQAIQRLHWSPSHRKWAVRYRLGFVVRDKFEMETRSIHCYRPKHSGSYTKKSWELNAETKEISLDNSAKTCRGFSRYFTPVSCQRIIDGIKKGNFSFFTTWLATAVEVSHMMSCSHSIIQQI